MTMPAQKPHRSRQNYETPPDFMVAVERRFGPIWADLAASAENTKAAVFLSEQNDALAQSWHGLPGLLWCNPPFADIAPWASKCREEAALGARILLLTPASVGSSWFAEHVHRHALVLALSPRLSFDGKAPYPKELILSAYSHGVGFDIWRWK